MCVAKMLVAHFMLKYCLDRCKAQEMCDKTIDDFLPALKFAPDWLFTSEMIEKLPDGQNKRILV